MEMSETLTRYDALIAEGGPSAIVLKEYLEPATGPGDVIFPPTFAPPEDQKDVQPSYIIDGEGENNVCLLDTVGSQANRLEPIFKAEKYRDLVSQIEISLENRIINLLDVRHRAADALVRATELASDIAEAFRESLAGNAQPLARIAPTSLVFGVWDSRGSQAKAPRLLDSTIRAKSVSKLTRSAQYFSPLDNAEVEKLLETDVQKQRKLLSKAGFLDAPSGRTDGGIIAHGEIVRTVLVNLTALRALGAPQAEEQASLRRYILGLTLVAALAPSDLFLRQGCLLIRAEDRPSESSFVYRHGRREPCTLDLSEVELFAKSAAEAFGVSAGRTVQFSKQMAKESLKQAAKVKEEG
jgi:CRISPR-associated protein Csb1